MPRPATPPAPTACPRCGSGLVGARRPATALDGRTICEPCQHAELDELIEQLERTPPGPALPANLVPIEEHRRARSAGGGR